jgi:hypothetical protein
VFEVASASACRSVGFSFHWPLLEMWPVATYNWIKAQTEPIGSIRFSAGVDIVGIDEMDTYIAPQKSYCWKWLPIIDMGNNFSTASPRVT